MHKLFILEVFESKRQIVTRCAQNAEYMLLDAKKSCFIKMTVNISTSTSLQKKLITSTLQLSMVQILSRLRVVLQTWMW